MNGHHSANTEYFRQEFTRCRALAVGRLASEHFQETHAEGVHVGLFVVHVGIQRLWSHIHEGSRDHAVLVHVGSETQVSDADCRRRAVNV